MPDQRLLERVVSKVSLLCLGFPLPTCLSSTKHLLLEEEAPLLLRIRMGQEHNAKRCPNFWNLPQHYAFS